MRKVTSFFGGLALVLAVASCNGYDQEAFSATLNGTSEVPASGSTATGTFALNFNGPVAEWTLTIAGAGLADVTAAHIHTGGPTVAAGGIYVFLFDGPAATITTLKGSFIADQVTACTPGCLANNLRTFALLQADVRAHTAYVNVHTGALTAGAIRGNF